MSIKEWTGDQVPWLISPFTGSPFVVSSAIEYDAKCKRSSNGTWSMYMLSVKANCRMWDNVEKCAGLGASPKDQHH